MSTPPIPKNRESFGDPPIPVHNSGAGRPNFPQIAQPAPLTMQQKINMRARAQAPGTRPKMPKLGG